MGDCVAGVHRGFLWFRVDSDTGAWYWRKGELEEAVMTGMAGILDETDQERADAAAEAERCVPVAELSFHMDVPHFSLLDGACG